jgi:hypothetical protein
MKGDSVQLPIEFGRQSVKDGPRKLDGLIAKLAEPIVRTQKGLHIAGLKLLAQLGAPKAMLPIVAKAVQFELARVSVVLQR